MRHYYSFPLITLLAIIYIGNIKAVSTSGPNVTLTVINSTALRVTWQEYKSEANVTIDKYMICYRKTDDNAQLSECQNHSSTTGDTSLTLTGLQPATEYEVAVKAWTSAGFGDLGSNKSTTKDGTPTKGPDIVNVTAVNSTALKVTWNKLDAANGNITEYTICYKKVASNGNNICNKTRMVDQLWFIITGLDSYTKYTIAVNASTSAGYGPAGGKIDGMTGEAAPDVGPDVISIFVKSSTELTVTWSNLSEAKANGVITHYTICWAFVASSNTCQHNNKEKEVTAERLSDTLEGLDKYTTYDIAVKAKTNAYGPYGVPKSNTTAEAAPDVGPGVISIFVQSSTELTVTWVELSQADANGVITNYTICWAFDASSKSCQPNSKEKEVAAERLSDTLEELDKYTTYVIAVKAKTNAYGPYGVPKSNTTAEAVPEIGPTILSVATKSSTELTVTWENLTVKEANGNIIGFALCYKIANTTANICENNKTTKELSFTLKILQKYTTYKVAVRASTSKGYGPVGNSSQNTTAQAEPEVGAHLESLTPKSSTKLYLKWQGLLKSQTNGKVIEYGICYKISESNVDICARSQNTRDTSNRSFILTNLNEDTNYTVAVRAMTKAGYGPPGNNLTATTNESTPSSGPDVTKLEAFNSTTLTTTWNKLSHDDANGKIIKYQICSRKLDGNQERCSETSDVVRRSFDITGLDAATKYEVAVKARTSVGYGPNGTSLSTVTKEGLPLEPRVVEITPSLTTIQLQWSPPEKPNGIITLYKISWSPSVNGQHQTNKTTFEITNLKPGTEYDIQISASTSAGFGKPVTKTVRTKKSGIQSTLPPTALNENVEDKETQVAFKLPTVNSSEEALIKSYHVIVKKWKADDGQTLRDTEQGDITYFSNSNDGELPYIAIAEKGYERSKKVTIGDGVKYPGKRKKRDTGQTYSNAPLKKDTKYGIFVRVFYNEDLSIYSSSGVLEHKTDASPGGPSTVVIVLVVVLVLVALLVIVFGVLLFRRRRKHDNSHKPIPMPVIRDHYPIPIKEFRAHCDELALNAGMGYQEEYESIQPKKPVSAEIASRPENIDKNRYNNIHAYDDTRVILSVLDGMEDSDYVNANHIDGFNREHQFIASQGPTKSTVSDFWRMIWEQEVSTMVMVTNPVEKGKEKCAIYWPQDKVVKHGFFTIRLDGEVELADFIIREMTVTKDNQSETRKVTQFHYTVWPDHGVPSYTTSLQAFLLRVRKIVKGQKSPLLVHCSAGVGRTGTFIGIFCMLDRIEARGDVDIYNFICQMRSQRVSMVQVESQYVLLHKAVLEAVECGDTEISATDVRIKMKKLLEVDPANQKQTLMQKQFKVLNEYTYKKTNTQEGKMPYNLNKNRNKEVIPYEDTRVSLLRSPGVDGSDYINASYIDSYQKRGMYIATQYPLENTVNDFWRMVWEKKSNCIIMLVNLDDEEQPYDKYWTEKQNDAMLCGNLLVTLENEEKDEEFVKRKFKLKKTDGGETRTVYHFNFLSWGENDGPKGTSGVLRMIDKTLEVQRNSGNHSIVVHCSDGAGRTGAFCALLTSLERVKQDHTFNLFQTIMLQRIQRPKMVASVEQYHFCLKVIRGYLDSFDDTNYTNFQ